MNLLKKILGELTVVVVRFTDAGTFGTTVFAVRRTGAGFEVAGSAGDTAEKDTALLKGRPVLLVATGYGVVVKRGRQAVAVADKVTAEPEKFVWSRAGDGDSLALSFMRREQLATAEAALEAQGVGIAWAGCSAAEQPGDVALEAAAAFDRESVRWKSLLRPQEPGALLAGVVVRRLRLPVLGLLLALLAGSNLFESLLRQHCSAMRARCAALQKEQGEAGRLSGEKRRTLDDFRRRAPYRFGLSCDRIGTHVPSTIVLDELSLSPFEEPVGSAGKPGRSAAGIHIAGRSGSAKAIAGFIGRLQAEAFAGDAALQSVGQGRDPGVLTFSIDIPR